MPEPLDLISVNHISRLTKSVDAALAFYRDVMGFRQVWRPDLTYPGAWLTNDRVMVHLIEGDKTQGEGEILSRSDHLAFDVADIDECERRLQAHGIAYDRKVQRGSGTVQIFFNDPDGNHIELGTYPSIKELN
ncbi:fosfomycin resistance protein FosB [Planctomycetes bacterium Pan216]|uniref:Fosfomycin resistance protein FosB n=1 Tax=Kolteria novifilia TaxID=2527975 RepID=A0A518B4F3_9BACT|nr:fosfomycin resistance protein FosB [Planctomycetes bacterium Pan216]